MLLALGLSCESGGWVGVQRLLPRRLSGVLLGPHVRDACSSVCRWEGRTLGAELRRSAGSRRGLWGVAKLFVCRLLMPVPTRPERLEFS